MTQQDYRNHSDLERVGETVIVVAERLYQLASTIDEDEVPASIVRGLDRMIDLAMLILAVSLEPSDPLIDELAVILGRLTDDR